MDVCVTVRVRTFIHMVYTHIAGEVLGKNRLIYIFSRRDMTVSDEIILRIFTQSNGLYIQFRRLI